MKRIMMIIMAVALIALPTMAQTYGTQEKPVFQSTSSMTPSGSVYSANPSLNANGTATYSPAQAPGMRKSGGDPEPPSIDIPDIVVDISDDAYVSNPIGDAVLPLTLMALAFCGVIYLRRRKALN